MKEITEDDLRHFDPKSIKDFDLKEGDKFTIEGYGVNKHGNLIIDGKCPRTGFFYNEVRPVMWTVGKEDKTGISVHHDCKITKSPYD